MSETIRSAIVESPTSEGAVVRVFDVGSGGVVQIVLDEDDWLYVDLGAEGAVSYPPGRIVCVYWNGSA